ncbi:kinase-like protein [Cubamyces sp. BRFM 1775]|nr:kinase-like protein [Cubamyces sp. BRFM 1775]
MLATVLQLYLWLRRRFGGKRHPARVVELPFGLMLKVTSPEGVPERDIIRFVKRHTSIPTPYVVASADGYECRFFVMKKVRGQTLESVLHTLDSAQQAKIVEQLQSFVSQLRSLKSPHGSSICGLDGKALMDSRITTCGPVGPFVDESAFNDRLLQTSVPFKHKDDLAELRSRMPATHAIVFTHGDIAPRNIMVQGDTVVAVLDWQQAGWHAEHWEFIKAKWCPPYHRSAEEIWNTMVEQLFDKDYTPEWQLDRDLSDDIVGGY